MTTEAYEAFIAQATSEMAKDLDAEQVEAAVTAMQKTKMLFLGAPKGTVLRNDVLEQTATRVINAAGIPLWSICDDAGNRWESHELILTPEGDWSCIRQVTP